MRALIFANIRQKSWWIQNSLRSQAFAAQYDTPLNETALMKILDPPLSGHDMQRK